MKKKRVLIDATPVFQPASGIGRTMRELLFQMSRMDHELDIHLFCRKMVAPHLSRHVPREFPTHHLRLPRRAEEWIRRFRWIERICPAELYHAADFYLPLAPGAISLATLRDVIYEDDPEPGCDHDRLRAWVPRYVKQYRKILTISEFSRQKIVACYSVPEDRVRVIYLGVDHGIFHPPEDRAAVREKIRRRYGIQAPFFLCVSCNMNRKNTPFLLETFRAFLTRQAGHSLVLVWSPPPEVLQEYAKEIEENRIRFLGRQSNEELRDLYSAATALIFPSLYEGFGLPVVEAMACGTPVIASRLSSIPEAGGDAAIYIHPSRAGEIQAALARFVEEPTLADSIRSSCIRQAAGFSWKRCAEETLDVYREILNEP